MRLGNSEVARTLDMSHSSVSRMRTGTRIGSADTLQALVEHYGADPADLLEAAALAAHGDTKAWVELLDKLLRDDVPDLEEELV